MEDFKAGRIVPFIGAGFSRPQFPSWENLLKENSKIYGIADEINKEIRIGNMEKAASLLEHKMGPLEFKDYFLETFDKKKIGSFTDNQLWLPKLFQSGIITTNYDHLLETLYREQLEYEFELLLPRYKKDEAAIDRVLRQNKHQCTRGYKRYKEMFQICRVEKSDFPLYFYILAGCAD